MRRLAVLAAAGAALGLLGCGEAPGRPHLLLIVVDTLRADHLGAYGHARDTSPFLDGLAAEGTLFLDATAPSSWTRPSVASLFTSRHPSEHGAVAVGRPLGELLPTLAEKLREAGYRTIGVSANFVHVSEDTGLARGFDAWWSAPRRVEEGDAEILWTGEGAKLRAQRADEVNRVALRSLPESPDAPVFLYVHYMEPHSPYTPPAEARAAVAEPAAAGRGPAASNDYIVGLAHRAAELDEATRDWLLGLYDAEIAAVDAGIRRLWAALRAWDPSRSVVTVVTSDHGEEFGEHGGWFHGLTLHAESLRVPLIFHAPGLVPAGVRSDTPVDLLDVPTTILALAGTDPAPGMRGRMVLARRGVEDRVRVAELHPDPLFAERVRPRRQRLALTVGPWKAIVGRDDDAQVYHLGRDPGERAPVPHARAPVSLLPRARALADRAAEVPPAAPAPDEATRARLRALGYAE